MPVSLCLNQFLSTFLFPNTIPGGGAVGSNFENLSENDIF